MWQFIREKVSFLKKKLQEEDGFINIDSRISSISNSGNDIIESNNPEDSAVEKESSTESDSSDSHSGNDSSGSTD